MLGDIGLVSRAVEAIFSAFIQEDQIPEVLKRRKLKALKEECHDALARNDFAALHDATTRLRDAASKP